MRIAMISTPFLSVPPRGYGGTERVVYELVEGLVARGHTVTLFAPGDSVVSAELRALFPEARWPPDPLEELAHVSWSMAQLPALAPDVVHVHCASGLAFGRLLPDLPLCYTLHHVLDESLSRFYAHFASPFYVAISRDQASRETMDNITVIHHGLNPADFPLGDHAGDSVAFIGRFARVKGPHTAIDVAAQAGVPLVVAGEVHDVDGPFAERHVLPRLHDPHVHFLGALGLADKARMLRESRALLVPIEWDEPFGLVLIEAMLSGCPVVAFPRGSVPEVVEPGITGFIVPDAAAMAEVIRPGGPLEGFDRRRCRDRAVQRFHRDRMVIDYERLYERAAAWSGQPRAVAAEGVIRLETRI